MASNHDGVTQNKHAKDVTGPTNQQSKVNQANIQTCKQHSSHSELPSMPHMHAANRQITCPNQPTNLTNKQTPVNQPTKPSNRLANPRYIIGFKFHHGGIGFNF
jgi:hypothetical protein